MTRYLIFSILFLLIVDKLGNVNGYKWIPLKAGDTLPENIVFIERSADRYVGRARHFDEILPAEITTNGTAFISSCHKEISKEQFEILTTPSEKCEWKSYNNNDEIDETALHVGTAWNGEPIYIGTKLSDYYPEDYHVTSIYITTNQLYTWTPRVNNRYYDNPKKQFLSCKTKNKWIDTSSSKLPNNTVSGGKSEEDYEIYVAQLKRGCDVVTGQVIPEMGQATAFLNDGRPIEASYCQVLVGEPNEYTWVSASDGEIPDYAVANGKDGYELAYVARVNNTIGHLTHGQALREQMDYHILIKNQL